MEITEIGILIILGILTLQSVSLYLCIRRLSVVASVLMAALKIAMPDAAKPPPR